MKKLNTSFLSAVFRHSRPSSVLRPSSKQLLRPFSTSLPTLSETKNEATHEHKEGSHSCGDCAKCENKGNCSNHEHKHDHTCSHNHDHGHEHHNCSHDHHHHHSHEHGGAEVIDDPKKVIQYAIEEKIEPTQFLRFLNNYGGWIIPLQVNPENQQSHIYFLKDNRNNKRYFSMYTDEEALKQHNKMLEESKIDTIQKFTRGPGFLFFSLVLQAPEEIEQITINPFSEVAMQLNRDQIPILKFWSSAVLLEQNLLTDQKAQQISERTKALLKTQEVFALMVNNMHPLVLNDKESKNYATVFTTIDRLQEFVRQAQEILGKQIEAGVNIEMKQLKPEEIYSIIQKMDNPNQEDKLSGIIFNPVVDNVILPVSLAAELVPEPAQPQQSEQQKPEEKQ